MFNKTTWKNSFNIRQSLPLTPGSTFSALSERVLASWTRFARGLSPHVLVVVHRAEVALAVIRLQVRSVATCHYKKFLSFITTEIIQRRNVPFYHDAFETNIKPN